MKLENRINKFEQDIANILSQLCYHIDPEIVAYIQEQNFADYDYFKDLFLDLIDVDLYLFKGSACVFPGVRRYVNAEGDKRRYNKTYRAIIDDNVFPRHLWCYLSNGKAYSGPNWKETGLSEFELAHVFTHKETEIDLESRLFQEVYPDLLPYADFTCACNIILLPKGTIRPTDNSDIIKSVFCKRYIELYGEGTLNGRFLFKEECIPDWYPTLIWNEPVKPIDWHKKTKKLMEYRKKRLTNIIHSYHRQM